MALKQHRHLTVKMLVETSWKETPHQKGYVCLVFVRQILHCCTL